MSISIRTMGNVNGAMKTSHVLNTMHPRCSTSSSTPRPRRVIGSRATNRWKFGRAIPLSSHADLANASSTAWCDWSGPWITAMRSGIWVLSASRMQCRWRPATSKPRINPWLSARYFRHRSSCTRRIAVHILSTSVSRRDGRRSRILRRGTSCWMQRRLTTPRNPNTRHLGCPSVWRRTLSARQWPITHAISVICGTLDTCTTGI